MEKELREIMIAWKTELAYSNQDEERGYQTAISDVESWLDRREDGWHDLEKDPNNLPGSGVHVYICIRGHPVTFLGYNTTSYGWHYDYGVPICTGTKICAWKARGGEFTVPERFKKCN